MVFLRKMTYEDKASYGSWPPCSLTLNIQLYSIQWVSSRLWRLSSKDCSLPHEHLLETQRVSNPATRKDLAARTLGVFWYWSKISVQFAIMVQIKQKKGTGVGHPPPRSLWCGIVISLLCRSVICYGVAIISRLLKISGLFCERALKKRLYSAKETYRFKQPINCSHHI